MAHYLLKTESGNPEWKGNLKIIIYIFNSISLMVLLSTGSLSNDVMTILWYFLGSYLMLLIAIGFVGLAYLIGPIYEEHSDEFIIIGFVTIMIIITIVLFVVFG